MSTDAIRAFVEATWTDSILPSLQEYVRIPNQSPAFDPAWREHGHMDRAVDLVASWIDDRKLEGARLEVVRLPGRTPLVLVDVASPHRATALLYGHLDKQPPMHGWNEGLGPWTPVVRDGRLYGRGAADDGYSAFASVCAIQALQRQGLPHPRCVIVIEACEESGSPDLPAYIDALGERIGRPELVVCLDSGCGNYDQMWVTTSLRGLVTGSLSVSTVTEGVHSGAAGGIVPSSFRIARLVLDRLEDARTGEIRPRELHAEIPAERLREAAAAATALGESLRRSYPWRGGTRPPTSDPTELLLNLTWRPALEVVGAAGLPPLENAGNVLRPETTLKLSLRLPPSVDANRAGQVVRALLEADPPEGADVRFVVEEEASGWNAPELSAALAESLDRASCEFFGRPARRRGEGGTIPFMAMLGERFPEAQFVITGVLGPRSNAHGPNEFLDIATGQKLTACCARLLTDQVTAGGGLHNSS